MATVTGLEEIFRRLKNLQGDGSAKILNKGLRAGAKIILAEQRAQVPVSTDPRLVAELLRFSLGIKAKTYRQSGVVVFLVGPRSRFGKDKKTNQRKERSWAAGKRVRRLFAKQPKATMASRQLPTAYAHLAGKGRRQEWFAASSRGAESRAQTAIIDTIAAEIEKAASR